MCFRVSGVPRLNLSHDSGPAPLPKVFALHVRSTETCSICLTLMPHNWHLSSSKLDLWHRIGVVAKPDDKLHHRSTERVVRVLKMCSLAMQQLSCKTVHRYESLREYKSQHSATAFMVMGVMQVGFASMLVTPLVSSGFTTCNEK
jgi:hypothetical protein